MRDHAIIEGFSRMEKMVGSDIRLLNKTVATLAIRMDAIQKLIFGGRFSFIWCAILSIFAPKALERSVDRIHQNMMDAYTKKMEDQMNLAKKAVIPSDEITNPKIVDKLQRSGIRVTAVLLIMLVGVGCSGNRVNIEDFDLVKRDLTLVKKDLESCKLSHIVLQTDLRFKEERLKKFNQLTEEGKLRGKNPCYDDPSLPGCQEKVDGTESWQK